MSAVASIVTSTGALLLSDGLVVDADTLTEDMQTAKVLATDMKKVGKVNDQVGLLWVGIEANRLQEFISYAKSQGAESSGAVANALSEFLQYVTYSYQDKLHRPDYNINVSICGYENGTPYGYAIATRSETGFTPAKYRLADPTIRCQMPFIEDPTTTFTRLYQKHEARSQNIEQAGLAAFKELTELGNGLIGGEIFSEVLTP